MTSRTTGHPAVRWKERLGPPTLRVPKRIGDPALRTLPSALIRTLPRHAAYHDHPLPQVPGPVISRLHPRTVT
jgi:hypothetical protein